MEVRRIGRLVPVDNEGYVVRDVDAANIRPPWDAPLSAVVEACLEHWGGNVHGIYVRGSVPRGLAVEGVSDIDCYALVRGRQFEIDTAWIEAKCHALDARFTFQTGVEIVPFSLEATRASPPPHPMYRFVQFSLATNCVCIHGEDLSAKLPRFRPGPEIAVRALNFPSELRQTVERLGSAPDAAETRRLCAGMMKRILRTGFELVMEREQAYTRDLYFCYEAFARHYPDREREMRRALELAVAPSGDPREVLAFVSEAGIWLLEQIAEAFPDPRPGSA